ncbi:hypothetical protein [Streptomyces sp. NRRL S-350]|uniref:hypothetical protein n=1 Tax=Streptomyces sp. NRRL S-350 TaxID=1463902 RepID=UPI0005683113|nr:hypothetical protein [Streptomyces sp. NRRL S-350]
MGETATDEQANEQPGARPGTRPGDRTGAPRGERPGRQANQRVDDTTRGAAPQGSAGETGSVCEQAPAGDAEAALRRDRTATGPRADCVLCGEPTELPADQPGSTLCPVCAWQQAQRIACSG